MRVLLGLALAFALVVFQTCAATNAPTFNDLQPIFEANCSGCHATNVKMGSLDLDTWPAMMKGGNQGTIVVPGKSAESRLYLMVARKISPGMPLSGKTLAAGEIEAIRQYIDAGALQPPVTAVPKPRNTIPDIAPSKLAHAAVSALAWSPDGKLVALGLFREVRIVDSTTQQLVTTLTGHAEQVRAVAWSADGKFIAAAGGFPSQKGEVKLWNAQTHAEVLTIKGHSDCIYAAVFSPDGKQLATAGYDKLIKLWDTTSGKEIRTLKDHIDAIYALAWTPDGKRLISAAADRAVKVWDPATGTRLYTMSEPTDGLNTIAVSPAGDLVAAGGLDKSIRVWQLGEKSATLKSNLIAHEDAILQLAWSPDGKTLISSGADRIIKAFSAPALEERKDWPKQSDWVTALRFSPDGKRFAAGRFDGSLEFYAAPK
jgi:WD40 repeat protein/mono/diheme cytochrome c family protein